MMYTTFLPNLLRHSKAKLNVARRFHGEQVCTFSSMPSQIKNLKHEHNKPGWIKFSHADHGDFCQSRPKLYNPFLSDIPLQSFLNLHVPREITKEISVDLKCFGSRIVDEIDNLAWECELHPPYLEAQDAWGQRTDKLKTCNAWKKQHDISAEEGIVAIAYENKLDYWSRLHQICKMYLYAPSSGLFSCPLAMTDGAAKTIKMQKSSIIGENEKLFTKALNNLTSRDPKKFWTSGQWMTERKGGSDVANGTETVAVPEGNFYRLYGYKWFSSASDSDMALTLARVVQSNEANQDQGLTMFYVETKDLNGHLNNIQMVRLKNKLGTRQVPTAELLLDGCVAYKMSEEGRGIAAISHMLNITRIHNSVAAVASMRRVLMLARDYSQNRVAFGSILAKLPLHMHTLYQMEMEVRGSLLLLLKVAILLGKTESATNSIDELLLLRLLSPILKLYTAKQSVAVASEGLEAFGGQGYMEDTGLPIILRDSQVLPIWEGTTNVLSMDVIRSIMKTNSDVLFSLEKSIALCLEIGNQIDQLKESCAALDKSTKFILHFVKEFPDLLSIAARDIAYSIARTYIGALLIENAAASKKDTDVFTAQQWCKIQELCPLLMHQTYSGYVEKDFKSVMEGYAVD